MNSGLSIGTYVHHRDGFDAFVIAANGKAALLMTKNARSYVVASLPVMLESGDLASSKLQYFDRASWKPDYLLLEEVMLTYRSVTKSLSS